MLLLMWLAGCSLVALASVALSNAEGPWLLGFAAIIAAQVVVVAGRAARLPFWVTWPLALACVAAYALAYGAADLVLYVVLVALLTLVVDRFAVLSVGLSAMLAPPDPIARDFARVRREESHLAVASISVAGGRRSSRRLGQIARELVPGLRMTDAVVRVATGREVVVILPGADSDVATAVLGRAPARERTDVLVGIATFPEDGQTFASLKEVARSRERPWSGGGGQTSRGRSTPGEPKLEPTGSRAADRPNGEERPAVFCETRPLATHLRRGADLLVLTLMAPFVVPLLALLALAVKLDSRGPAVVRIRRLGRDGRPFDLFKLRSMTRDADRMKETLKHLNTLAWPDFKIADDPRVTRVGRLLRKYSLDELPQLYNVLRGEMTFVGPRPCSVKLADYDLWQSERLDVTPGLVGRWQAEGRGSVDFAERCRLDIRQARSRSIRVNLQLVVATVRSVFASKGAY
jgi:lipopolysaccharide/colanic/teichoic acid biosynthesis glycosyltransferase